MIAAQKLNLISVEDYLAGELVSPVKHEYLGGIVYAMAGAGRVHNRIATNTVGSLHARLKGRRCEVFNSDMKVRVTLRRQVRFYYPDVSVVCQQKLDDESFNDEPVVIFEVLSRRTRRLDEGEKLDAYLMIPSLCVYGLIEQETALVVVYRRTEQDFECEVYEGMDAVIPLHEIEAELPLAEIYDRVQFSPEPLDEDATDSA
jgi:Uma2 family endonuclease